MVFGRQKCTFRLISEEFIALTEAVCNLGLKFKANRKIPAFFAGHAFIELFGILLKNGDDIDGQLYIHNSACFAVSVREGGRGHSRNIGIRRAKPAVPGSANAAARAVIDLGDGVLVAFV